MLHKGKAERQGTAAESLLALSLMILPAVLSPAHAAQVCGSVDLLGRSLPSGFVSLVPDARAWAGPDALGGRLPHPGPTEKSFVRIRSGRFCVKGVAPGNYRLNVSPMDNTVPYLSVSYQGLPVRSDDWRLSVEPSGSVGVFDPAGVRVGSGSLVLAYLPEPPQPNWSRLEGAVHFPADARFDPQRAPALLFARSESTATGTFQGTYHFAWLDGPLSGRSQPFVLPVGPGRLLNLWVRGGDLTMWSLRLPRTELGVFKTAQPVITMGPAGGVQGTLYRPDGRPFLPDAGPDPRKRSQFSLRIASFWDDDDTADGDFVDSEGHYELTHVRPGFHRLLPVWQGDAFPWSAGPAAVIWIRPGETVTHDLKLGERADVRIDPEGGFPAALPGIHPPDVVVFWMRWPREHWVVGIPSGALDARRISNLLLSDEAPFSFLQDSQGDWRPRFRDRPTAELRTPPGRYDAYLLETTDKFSLPSVRVLAVQSGMSVEPGKTTTVRFLRESRFPAGGCELRGTLKGSRPVPAATFRGARSLSELHTLIAPRVHLYDAQGRFAAAAFVTVPYEEMGELIEAVEQEHKKGIVEFFDRRPTAFLVAGLAPGRYRAEIVAAGYPTLVREVALSEGTPMVLAIDLDNP